MRVTFKRKRVQIKPVQRELTISHRRPLLAWMFLVSFLIHVLFVSIFELNRFKKRKRAVISPVYIVELIHEKLPTPAPVKKVVKKKPTVIKKKPKTKKKRIIKRKRAIKPKKEYIIAKKKKVKPKKKKKIEDEKRIAAAIEAIKKKLKEKEKEKEEESVIAPPAFNSKEMNLYYQEIWRKIRKNWLIPENLLDNFANLECIIIIKIEKDGTISYIKFEKSSGNAYYDKLAFNAVEKSNPLPPIPSFLLRDSISVGLIFNLENY
ncbi:MAG: hypothetical protein DRG20_03640 [Deltaproteobacteria bacterium]|nr:MAG: hypothetical protein DRG20_03640 [Deltaproteobacteria bacterium]